jgi:uncharacterized delta-60 repeat protein
MKKLYMLLMAAFFMLITGCGGNGGDSAPSSVKAITAFSLNRVFGTINETGKTIAVAMPFGTDVTSMVATFTTTGASIKVGSTIQTSGTTTNDFTSPVVYTVTAANATTQDYTVTVTVSSSLSGSLDTTFGTVGKVTTPIGSGDDHALALGIQSSDGKIVAAGFSYNGSNYDFALARYNTDGTLDTGFGTGGKVTTDFGSSDDFALALGIQPDGKIVAAGYSYNGSKYYFALVRYNANGTLDTGFGTGGIVSTLMGSGHDQAHSLGIQPDGKIVAAGYAYNGSKYDFALVRYNANGTLDTGFGTGGIVTTSIGSINDYANALGIQSDGRIVAAGYSSNGSKYDFALARYNTDGSLDTTFGTGGKVITPIGSGYDQAHALGIQSDGKIVAAGSSDNGIKYNFALVRYNANGTLDTGFGTGGKVTTPIGSGSGWDVAYALCIQSSDGRIVAAGSSNNGSNYDFALVRYNANGTLDTGFGTGGKVTTPIGSGDDYAIALGIQSSDGKIVAAGYSYNGSNDDFALARYWP